MGGFTNDQQKIPLHFVTDRKSASNTISRILEDVDRSLIETKINVKSSEDCVELEIIIQLGIGFIGINATKKFMDLLMEDLYKILKNKIIRKSS